MDIGNSNLTEPVQQHPLARGGDGVTARRSGRAARCSVTSIHGCDSVGYACTHSNYLQH